MSKTQTFGIIRPETVAHKLAAIRNYEHPELLDQINANPRLVEMLWFLQFISMQPGGLVKFCAALIQELPERFGTQTMRSAKPGEYAIESKVAIWSEIPRRYLPPDAPSLSSHHGSEDWEAREILQESFGDYKPDARDQKLIEKFLRPWTAAAFRKLCCDAALDALPGYLEAICTEGDKGFTKKHRSAFGSDLWFVDDPIAAVIEMMDRHASNVSKRLAMTVVTKKVFDALDYALQEKAMVRIEGDSRFGKTESVKAWCEMRPGLARLVSVPSSNSIADLHRRIAEALGIDVSYGSRKQGVKERIEYVLQHSGMFIVLDEAAFLVPQNYTASTAPARLNWVRTEIVDRGLPLAVVVTPQSFLPLVARFIKKTGYAMEQFFGRNHRAVQLPEELDAEDMIAVAKIHFPEMGKDYLELIADMASVSENYLQAVEAIAKLARYFARRDGHRNITVNDLEAASAEVIPRRVAPQCEAAAPAQGFERPRGRHQELHQTEQVNTLLKGRSRAIKPVLAGSAQTADFQSRSLRSAGPERVETEIVPVET